LQNFPSDHDHEEKPPHWLTVLALTLPRMVLGWAGDSGRLLVGLIGLNFRKTLFRLRRGRGRCPCQNPSDSGRAMQTSCDAMLSWSRPIRFRRLCPLLRQNPAGEWRCSVDTADVRPFWGRAFAYLGGGIAGLYLAAALAAFLFLRIVGYPVTIPAVAWPPAWHQIDRARAQYFTAKAEAALRENNSVAAMMALSQSYQLDPSNYDVGRMLAQFSQPGWGDTANRVYQQLMREHPERRGETAAAWFLALLSRGDFPTIVTLAADRVAADPAWLNALLFASRRTGDSDVLRRLLAVRPPLPPYVSQVLTLELELRAAGPAGAPRLLERSLAPSPAPFLVYYFTDRQLRAGLPDAALLTLKTYGNVMAPRDRIELVLATYAAEGWESIARSQVEQLLNADTNPPAVELVCAQLIRNPDPAMLDALFAAVYRRPLPKNGDLLGAYTSLFCAAGAEGDWLRLQAAAAELKSLTRTQFTSLDVAEAYFRAGRQGSVPLARCLRSLPGLPIDVTYAMYDYADRRK